MRLNCKCIEIERSHDERRQQLLHHIDEDNQQSGQQVGPQYRQMHLAQQVELREAEGPKGLRSLISDGYLMTAFGVTSVSEPSARYVSIADF